MPQRERAIMQHLTRIPEDGSRSGGIALGPQLSQHSSLSRFVPPHTPFARARASNFRRSFGIGTPHSKAGISSRAFGPQSAMPSFMRTFGTENLDQSTESVPADFGHETQDQEVDASHGKAESDESTDMAGSIKLDLKVRDPAHMQVA